MFIGQTRQKETDEHDKPEFRFNSTDAFNTQKIITTQCLVINVRLCP